VTYYDYVIIGGGIAGAYSSFSLRENDKKSSICIISEEKYLPYDRTTLSKSYLLDKIKEDKIFIKDVNFYKNNKIDIINKKAVKLDIRSKTVILENNEEIKYNKLLLATGGKPRKLKIENSDLKRIYYLRNLEDCKKIKDEMKISKNALIIGGGFIGCELASAFSLKGIKTTIIEKMPYLLQHALDEETAKFLTNYFKEKNVNLVFNTSVSAFEKENDSVKGVIDENGNYYKADFVIIAVGIELNTELVKDSNFNINNGIVTDEYLETNVKDIFAAGDIANFYSTIFKRHIRVEHYDVAVKHGKYAGINMINKTKECDFLPYFFSFMFDLNINVYGIIPKNPTIIKRVYEPEKKRVMQFYLKDGIVEGMLIINYYEEINEAKEIIKRRLSIDNTKILEDKTVPLKEIIR